MAVHRETAKIIKGHNTGVVLLRYFSVLMICFGFVGFGSQLIWAIGADESCHHNEFAEHDAAHSSQAIVVDGPCHSEDDGESSQTCDCKDSCRCCKSIGKLQVVYIAPIASKFHPEEHNRSMVANFLYDFQFTFQMLDPPRLS